VISMKNIHITINDDLEDKFRKEVAKRLGLKKGNISIAMEEAINIWINKNDKKTGGENEK